ncbi:MAG: hypothetical protein V1919_01770 [Candidatus Omnitrophota bacterium]
MKTRNFYNIALGITTEISYALLIIFAAFIACQIFCFFYLKV